MTFVKLDARTLDSSLWSCDPDRIVFLTMLMMAEPYGLDEVACQLGADSLVPTGFLVPPGAYGLVRTSSDGILRRALVPDDVGIAALWRLSHPDQRSRSARFDGRRVARVDGGWIVLNYAQFREIDATAPERMRKYRARVKAAGVPGSSENVRDISGTRVDTFGPDDDGEVPFSDRWPEIVTDAWKLLWDDFRATKVPRPIGKKQAERHFRASIKNQTDLDGLGRALIAYRASERVLSGFVQQASTWLNNWRDWENYQEPLRPQPQGPRPQGARSADLEARMAQTRADVAKWAKPHATAAD